MFPFVGAACGFAVGVLVTIGTQLAYPMVTGGQPLLAIPPMLIVLFEATLLGAILLTVAGVLFESRLPASRGCRTTFASARATSAWPCAPNERRAEAERVLRECGAIDVVG